ncbi:FMN-binding protein [Isachenkonia alkalipeptolytica]|uniref:FMN-binding protein n=1 Tax=Isachenkonia alkalipeptolytica TaxID=2565777 RepID=A0AA43XLF8_9CLOT|nr:FMN-binding protein [Isachenkonia alkalipeptolytica]NBG88055.1 FMN-binding protein [Isachenkonia alkalipeptolytica]
MDKKQIIATIAMVLIAVVALLGYDALREDVTAGAQSYEVTAEGYGGAVRLEVFISDEEIVEIEVLEQNETEGLGDDAIFEVIERIIENNSTEVEVVSGATISSDAAITAVENALAEAGLVAGEAYNVVAQGYGGDIELEVIIADGEIAAVNIIEHSETEGLGDEGMEETVATIIEEQSVDVDTVSGATESSEAVISGVKEALEDAGVELGGEAYEQQGTLGTGSGYGGEIILDVVTDGEEILDIVVVEESETGGLGDIAIDEIIESVLEAQSTEVDSVSGATESSEGALEAIEDALDQ